MTRKKIKTLLLAAYPKELAAFVDLGQSYQRVDGNTAYLAAGIGPVAAAFGLTHFLEDYVPQEIVAIGTAGIIAKEGLALQDLVCVRQVSAMRVGQNADWATYVPELQISKLDLPTPTAVVRDLPRVRVMAPQEISQGAQWQTVLAKHHDVEHLESFAYAFVAQKFKIPITILLGVTNSIGPNAQAEWKQHEAVVMQKIKNRLLQGQIL